MADSTLVISDRTPLLERRESMSSADGNFRAFDNREKELRDLENMYDISQNVQIENVIPIDLNVVQMECPPELISANIMCIFAVAFDNRAGYITKIHNVGRSWQIKLLPKGKHALMKYFLRCMIIYFSSVVSHINTKRIQAEEFRNDKINLNIRTLQVDVAMNYSCTYQDEVQNAIWARINIISEKISSFTAALYDENICQTFLICSDATEKEKNTIQTFTKELYRILEPNSEKNKNLREII